MAFHIQASPVPSTADKDATAFAARLVKNRTCAKDYIKAAQERQTEAANKKRNEHTAKVGDKVLLSNKITKAEDFNSGAPARALRRPWHRFLIQLPFQSTFASCIVSPASVTLNSLALRTKL